MAIEQPIRSDLYSRLASRGLEQLAGMPLGVLLFLVLLLVRWIG